MERNEKGYPTPGAENRCDGDCLQDMPLGYAYVPIQRFRMTYSPVDGLNRGTLFEELYLPLGVYGNE